ncbi:hypothetical protein [Pontibacillus litoralis]|uniref:Uncharacterized protein n=1 Tax=Pontibacillus litoralis JSM 072002 TaxID=1385512 RepID=A0A0A5G0K2_9BACI|nr:hypothetical protein [Pontibacillus litoralis]KGX84585.1 hypothetical protein N784_13105 [Pontibacillus litoralis JSM 072002]
MINYSNQKMNAEGIIHSIVKSLTDSIVEISIRKLTKEIEQIIPNNFKVKKECYV